MQRFSAYSVFSHLGLFGLFNWLSDEQYLKIQFFLKMHKRLDLESPRTFNEKLQWLKINDRKQCYCEFVDKYLVRTHIEKVVGSEYLIPLVGVWENPDNIDFEKLPNRFVLKCNHDSGGVIICRDKTKLDVFATKTKLKKRLNRNYSWGNREWPYKSVHRLIIAEKLLSDSGEIGRLTDYKIYCFNGVPHCILACVDRKAKSAKYIFYDLNWNRIDYSFQTDEERKCVVPKPENLEKMLEVSESIAKYVGSAFVRIDLFNIKGKIFFGEITFFPHSGMDATLKPEIDRYFGGKICLSLH